MRSPLALIIVLTFASMPAVADVNDLVISEVLECASNLKYVEIHNMGPDLVDLDDAAADVRLLRYANGGATPANIDLTGTIAAGGFYVVANNATDFNTNTFGFDADQYSGNISHNGNDKYELENATSATVLDGFAADNIGNTSNFARDRVAFRVGNQLPNNGDWGGTTEPAFGATSDNGFWTVLDTNPEADALLNGTPGTAGGSGGSEVPVELFSFSIE